MSEAVIRRARQSDAQVIADIYNHYIEHSVATFDTVPKSIEERTQWLLDHDDKHPVFVAEKDGVVIAWSSLSAYHPRPAYRHTLELGIYVAEGHTGEGLGPVMLQHLIDTARSLGCHVLVSLIVASNEPSIKMGERAGFTTVGTLSEVGYKFGEWHDVVIMQMLLEESPDACTEGTAR